MLLSRLVDVSGQVAATSKRLEKIDLIAAFLRQLTPDEVEIATPYLSGYLRQGRIGIGYAAIRDSRGPGVAVGQLELLEVDRELTALAGISGRGSATERSEKLASLMARATSEEQRFLEGLLAGELRQGALEGIMVEALAKAANLPADRVRRATMLAGDIAIVARAVLEHGATGLARYSVELFRPVQPMLAQTAEDVDEALAELGEASLEWKLDGARIQVHKSGKDVAVYSRALNEVTGAVPEVVEAARNLPVDSAILDGEVISLLPDGRPQPFQVTMRRFGRKLDVEKLRDELPLTPFWFDALYLNGGDVLDEPQARRFSSLIEIAPPDAVIPHLRTADNAAAREFIRTALDRGHEGVMAKAVSAPYAAGARGQSWLKIKQPRTLDLVILAAEWGNGRRRGWLSNLHLGARDVEKGGFAMLGKTFKGLTDEMLAWQTKAFQEIEVARDPYTVYLEPKIVAEIAFNEIQVSQRYESGLALRFARVKRYRPDKTVAESDTFQTVKHLAGI